jgi:hypothetical protein
MVLGIEPAMIFTAKAIEGPKFDHRIPPCAAISELM